MYGYGNSLFLTANKILASANAGTPPVNTVAPAITGIAQEGQVVTCSTGTWTGTPTITYAYQWKRNGSNIGSATNSTYTLVTADVSQSITCELTATNAVGSANATSNTITPTSAVDPDAQAFITAAGITDSTQQAAINTLVTDLKGYNIWTKFKAIYPIVGGVASSHAVNLKTPGTYNLTFASGWTHSATGMLPNGASAYADTNLQVNLITQNNGHLSYYSRSNTAGGAGTFKVEVGYLKITPSFAASSLAISRDGASFGIINSTGSATTTTNADTRGFYVANRLSSSVQTLDKNGSVVNTSNDTSVAPPSNVMSYWIGARNSPDNSGAINYSDRECSFSSLGDGLTPTERANFRTAVQAFQTTLNRQI